MTQPVSISAGQPTLASDFDAYELATAFWTPYTPTWSSTGTQPVLGNGSITGAYLNFGRTCIYTGILTIGSTTTFGTGSYLLSVPVNLSGTNTTNGFVWLSDSSASASNRMGFLAGASATTVTPLTTSGNATATNPWTWANGDSMRWWVAYPT